MKKGDLRTRASMEIMHFVLSYSVGTKSAGDNGKNCWCSEPFIGDLENEKAAIGALVILACAPASKYQIGWLRNVRFTSGRAQYLIETLDGSSSGWWGNVGLKHMPSVVVDRHPEWAWTDSQWAFSERWERVCYKDKKANWHRPFQTIFGPGHKVTIGLRTKFAEDDKRAERTFDDWRKLTKADLLAVYDDCYAEKTAPENDHKRLSDEDEALRAAGVTV